MSARWPGLRVATPLRVEFAGRRKWRLTQPMTAVWHGGSLHVPAGYCTDLATVPRPFRNVISSDGDLARAAVFHDALYTDDARGGHLWSRSDADDFFLALAAADGASWLARNLAWTGIRLGGWAMWRDGVG